MFCLVKKCDPKIDYVGQELAFKLMYSFLLAGYAIALLAGVILHDLTYTLYIGIATVIFTFIATIPAWPFFRMNPLKFKGQPKAKKE